MPRLARDDAPATEDEIMAVTMARLYDNDSICAVGAVSPLAMVSYLLAKHTHAPAMIIMPMSSGFVGIAARPMSMLLGETLDWQTSFMHCGGDDTYHEYYQRGLVTHEVVSAAQIDRFGRTNNIAIKVSDSKTVRLPGQGGMADVANMHRNFLLYLTRHSPRSLVAEVDISSAARGLLTDEERRAAGYQPGYVRLVTNLGVFDVNHTTRRLELVSVHPGVTVEQVAEATGFPLRGQSDASRDTPAQPGRAEPAAPGGRPAGHSAAGVHPRQGAHGSAWRSAGGRGSGRRRHPRGGGWAGMIELTGSTWDHPRGLDGLVATAAEYHERHPEVRVTWETRSLQDFADFSVERLAERFDLVIYDHPFVGEAARLALLLAARRIPRRGLSERPGRSLARREPPQLPMGWPPVGPGGGCGLPGQRVPPGSARRHGCRAAGQLGRRPGSGGDALGGTDAGLRRP